MVDVIARFLVVEDTGNEIDVAVEGTACELELLALRAQREIIGRVGQNAWVPGTKGVVDQIVFHLAIAGDRLQREIAERAGITQLPVDRQPMTADIEVVDCRPRYGHATDTLRPYLIGEWGYAWIDGWCRCKQIVGQVLHVAVVRYRGELRNHRPLALLLPVVGVVDRHRLDRLPAQCRARHQVVLIPDVPTDVVLDEGIAALGQQRQAGGQRVRQRAFDVGLGVLATEVAGGERHFASQLVTRLAGMQDHRAAHRVLSVQGALRTTQHFDALELCDIEERADRLADVDAVDVDTDHRVLGDREVGTAQATHAHTGGVVATRGRHDDQVGRHLADPRDIGDAHITDVARAVCSDRYRNLLQAFLPAPCRDRDFLDATAAGRLFLLCLRLCGASGKRCNARSRDSQRQCMATEVTTLEGTPG